MCGLAIEVDGETVVSVRGDPDDVLSHGFLCPKGVALGDLQGDPDRLRQPVRRTSSGWETLPWEEALDEAAEGLDRVRREHGPDAVASYAGNPVVHDPGLLLFLPLLLRSLGTKARFSATSVDQLPQMVAASLMFGHGLLVPVPDVDRTGYFLVLGANPVVSGGSMMSAPGMPGRIARIRARGGKVVVLDPRRTETARAADEHHFVRPGSDALFLLAFVGELLGLGAGLGRLAPFTDGLERVREAVKGFTPEVVAQATGIEPETTRRLAREFHQAGAAVAYGRVGLSTQPFGGLCAWLVTVVNAVSGNLDRPGGAMFTRPAFDVVGGPKGLAPALAGFGRRKTRVRGLPSFAGELPVAALAEEILTPGPGQVRALVTMAGNPVLSTPNGGQLDRALASLDFMVSVDPYLNETTRHARIVLPGWAPLERGHYDVALSALAVRNTARYSPPVLAPPPGTLPDWKILLELKRRLDGSGRTRGGAVKALGRAVSNRLLASLGPEGILDLGLRLGPYGAGFGLGLLGGGLTMGRLRSAPHGVDLGPLEPCLPERLKTRGRRIDLAPEAFVADLARLKARERGDVSGGELLLVGRRSVRDNNSWMHNVPRLMRGRERCRVLIHPDDARDRAIGDGDLVEVSSRVGKVRVPAEVTGDVMAGVVSLPHGYGHGNGHGLGRAGMRARVAAAHAGASANDLTDDRFLDDLTGNAAFSGVPVRVVRVPPADAPSTDS